MFVIFQLQAPGNPADTFDYFIYTLYRGVSLHLTFIAPQYDFVRVHAVWLYSGLHAVDQFYAAASRNEDSISQPFSISFGS